MHWKQRHKLKNNVGILSFFLSLRSREPVEFVPAPVQDKLQGLLDLLCQILAIYASRGGQHWRMGQHNDDGKWRAVRVGPLFSSMRLLMLKRKDPERVSNRCSVVFTFVCITVFVNHGSKSEPVCMDHHTWPFVETLYLLGCRFSARLSGKKVPPMSTAWVSGWICGACMIMKPGFCMWSLGVLGWRPHRNVISRLVCDPSYFSGE